MKNVAAFSVTDFAAGDEIQLIDAEGNSVAASTIEIDGAGNLLVETDDNDGVAISGVSVVAETLNAWSYDAETSLTSYAPATVAGASLDGGRIIYAADDSGEAIVKLSGAAENAEPAVIDGIIWINDRIFAGDSLGVELNAGDFQFYVSAENKKFVGTSGADTVTISGAMTFDGKGGGDEISIAKGVTAVTLENFGADDTIKFAENISTLTTIEGGVLANGVSISGVNLQADDYTWTLESGTAKLGAGKTAGVKVDSGVIVYEAAEISGDILVELGGVATTDGINVTRGTVELVAQNFSENGISVTSAGDEIRISGGVGVYGEQTIGGAFVEGGVVKFRADNFPAENKAVELDGISGAPVVDSNVVYLAQENFAGDTVSIVSGGGYQLCVKSDVSGKTILGSANADNIYNEGSNVTISGGDDADNIESYGDNISISGGSGKNTVTLNRQTNITVNTSQGDDTINVGNVTELNVEGFGAGDEIHGVGDSTTINGVDWSTEDSGKWILDGSSAKYVDVTLAGAYKDGDAVKYRGESVGTEAAVQIDGIASVEGMSYAFVVGLPKDNISADGATVVKNSGATFIIGEGTDETVKKFTGTSGGENITVYGGADADTISAKVSFTVKDFAAGDVILLVDAAGASVAADSLETVDGGIKAGAVTIGGIETIARVENSWSGSTYQRDTIAGAAISDGKIIYDSVSGVTSTDGVEVDIDAQKITLGSANVGTENLSVDNGYEIILDNSVARNVHKDAGWKTEGGKLVYATASESGGFDGLNYVEAVAAKSFALEGLSDSSGVTIDGSKVILSAAALANASTITLTTTDRYELALAEGITAPVTENAAWHWEVTTAEYYSATSSGYVLANNKVSYVEAGKGETLITLTSVQSSAGVALAGSVVTISAAALAQDTPIMLTGAGYTLALADDVAQPETKAPTWYLSGTTAEYYSEITAGYKIEGNTISYEAESVGETLITLTGVNSAEGILVEGTTVTLAAENLGATDVTIIGAGYTLALAVDVLQTQTVDVAAAWAAGAELTAKLSKLPARKF